MNDPAATIRRDAAESELDQPICPLSASSFCIHPSAFLIRLWFLAKDKSGKSAPARRSFGEGGHLAPQGMAGFVLANGSMEQLSNSF